MTMNMKRALRVLFGAVLVAVIWFPAPAAAQVRLAEVTGTVTDPSGSVLPGVTVTATHVDTGQVRTTVTQAGGVFSFGALPLGRHEIRAELQGFNTAVFRDVRLGIGDVLRLDIQLSVAALEESVTVLGETPLVDVSKSDLGGRINLAQVEELPLSGRNWMNLATLAPGVKSAATEGQPTAGLGGSNMSKVFVDGASVQNRSTVAVDMQISKEVIGEFEVLTNRFDASLGRAGTSFVNAATKSGTDRYSGSLFFHLRDDALSATDFFTGTKEPYQNRQFGGTFGGPLVQGRTHFFTNYERQVEPQTLSANTGIAGLDAPVDGTDSRNIYFARIDHSLTANHRLNFRFNRFDRVQPNVGVGGARVAVNAINYDFEIHRVAAGIDSVIGDRFVNRFQVTYMDSLRRFARVSEGVEHAFPSISLGGSRTGIGREHPFYWFARSDASYFFERAGQHNLKFGFEFEHGNVQGAFYTQTNGTFFYGQDPPNLATCCLGTDQSAWDSSLFPVPLRYTQVLGDVSISAPNYIYGAYIQDDWSVLPRLTLNLGLRYDLEVGSLAHDVTGLAVEPRKNDALNFQPRVGFAWDVAGRGATVIRGGGGLYYDQAWLNLTFNHRRTNTGRQATVTTFNTANDPNFVRDPLGGRTLEDFLQAQGAVNVTRFAPDAQQPHLWTGSVGIAQQLTPMMAVSADYVIQRSDAMLVTLDTNLFCCLPDGNAIPINSGNYPELGGFVAGAGRPDPRFNVINNYTFQGTSRYHGLQVALNRRMSGNYQFGLSYLLSANKDTGSSVNNVFNLADEYGTSALDERHRLVGNWVTRLPYGLNFGGIFYASSGQALSVSTGGIDINGDGSGAGDRPTCGLDPRFNAGCATLGLSPGQRVPRNPLRSDSVFKLDLRVSRPIAVRGIQVDPMLEIFNVLNRRNYAPGSYNTNLVSANFGQPGRSSLLMYSPLQVQLGARLTF
jgi:hypothetical protein